ncbi:MAG: hypothetical protein NDI82_01460, partial [Anaeromyxobacteraceae bacterium]|nr:hypothetical protein [Anaeromyxobacteraceae bacterium]
MFLRVEAEAAYIVLGVLCADRTQQADRDHVLGFRQCSAQGHRTVVFAVVILWLPCLRAGFFGRDRDGFVGDHGGGGVALFQAGGVDEGLEAGTGLAPGLRDMVELVAVEIESAHQCPDGAIDRTGGDERRFDVGQLDDLPALVHLLHADHRATPHPLVRRGFLVQHAHRKLEPLVTDPEDLSTAQVGAHQFGRGLQNDCRQQVVTVVILGQQFLEFLVLVGGDVLDFYIGFRATVAVSPVVVDYPAAHRPVGGLLLAVIDGGDDAQPAAVNVIGKPLGRYLARHFGDVLGVDAKVIDVALDVEGFGLGRLPLDFIDESKLVHAAQDVALAQLRTLRIHHRIEARRRFRQSCEHRCFGNADVLQRLAIVDVGSGGETIGTLPQVYLVDVELKDLILAEIVLDFESQQHLVELSRQGFFGRKEEVAGHLHGDGRRTLASPA